MNFWPILSEKAEIIEFFRNRFDIPPLLNAFLNVDAHFLQTYLKNRFSCCLAVLAKLYLTDVEFFGERKYLTVEFLSETLENPRFL